ncbi:MAG: 3-hydroxyacyl-CoA dehydrogenase NAD-binding domain-containing protein [Gammaproteobacteria bacterium]|nr:3-hydroxyacyl-CoA dehydrogenase NAD-binding domain-containing protein [Gammaproteobacteria bacterium]MDH3751590.1 3-hydroxyacyl-CoA dehydrogenase NAD-binding domain-containing protein [Gammaproteobacteria bacterium]
MYAINRAAVIGAGTMGLGIAGQLANAGVDVLLLDIPADGENRNAIAERALERLLNESQPGLLHADNLERITIGNIEDDMPRLAAVDWIAEAVVERLDIKQALYKQIDAVRKQGSIVSSNTSTIPISLLVADMPTSFREEFAITHFFNPVRFMRLLEIVRGEATRIEVIEYLEHFAEFRLGKGIVVCNDTPGFLGNRVGVYAIQMALQTAFRMGLTPEEADAIFGRPMGIPKTGVFGLYDLIGIDLMSDVARSLVSILPDDDVFHNVAAEIPVMIRMIDEGYIGNKAKKGGFYQPADLAKGISRKTLDFESFTYRDHEPAKPQLAVDAELAGNFTLLLQHDDKYGRYAWEILAGTLCYAAALVPDVNDSLVAVDDAMKLGYNWIQGPFEMIDAIGVDRFITRLEKENRDIPDFVRTASGKSFYRVSDGALQYLLADGSYQSLQRAKGIRRFSEERRTLTPLEENAAASFFELENKVGLVEFHSKANALGPESMQLLEFAVKYACENMTGLIIHNDAQHFSCGADLGSILGFIVNKDMAGLDRFLDHYQQTLLAMKYAPIPVVAAPSGLSMGGGFEVLLHTDKVIFHANSVTGLVESLVGVVPGGGGVKEMLYRWYERTGDINKAAWNGFMNIGYGKTARSPLEAEPLAMFRDGIDEYVMNRDRLLDTAMSTVRDMADNYRVVKRTSLAMPGRDVFAEMVEWLQKALEKGSLMPHDVTTGTQIAMIVTGGDIQAGVELSENDLCELERKAFVTLGKTAETRARIEFMLKHGSPLRN